MPPSPRLLSLGPRGLGEEFARMGVDPRGVSRMAGKARHHLVRLEEVDIRAAHIIKQDMLAVGGDAALAREAASLSVRRTPVLLMGTARQLAAFVERSAEQPFGVAETGRAVGGMLAGLARPPRFFVGGRDLLRGGRVLVMGILNVTPDSFSDGGRHAERGAAVSRGLAMADEGADFVDVGGESTRPGSRRVPAAVQRERVVPVIRDLFQRGVKVLSVDTTRPEVAAAAFSAGASIVNDVSCFSHRNMAGTVAAADASAILMHMRGTPATMQRNLVYRDLMGEIHARLGDAVARAREAGLGEERLAVDPGLGFGKSAEQNLEILARLRELRSLGTAVAVGASRKSFIGKVLKGAPPEARLEGSVAAAVAAVLEGADIVRVHDVAQTVKAVAVAREVRAWTA